MTEPITLDIPHSLGRAVARQRLESGVGQIAGILPGGSLKEHRWEGDTLLFVIATLGQRVAARIDVLESKIHAVIDVPPFAALFANAVKDQLGQVGTKLLR